MGDTTLLRPTDVVVSTDLTFATERILNLTTWTRTSLTGPIVVSYLASADAPTRARQESDLTAHLEARTPKVLSV